MDLISCILLTLTKLYLSLADDPLVIHTENGPVLGATVKATNGDLVDAWYSIPYAQPPIGELRFRHPRPHNRWTDIKNTTKLPNSCWQIKDTFFGDFAGSTKWNANTALSEDCLYVSVIVPKPRPNNAAVMVWIYGGGFFTGSSTLDVYNYETLATEQKVIVVALQYRVASLGFLYSGTEEAPGNAGMFDQLMALHWVNKNIEFFGGNKNNVTLFGESAGAASISLHLISPLSQNLFSQAIMQSASATVPWGLVNKKESKLRTRRLAEYVNCPHRSDNMDQTLACLRIVSAETLVHNEIPRGVVDFVFVPIIDGVFIDRKPLESLKSGYFKKTNIMMGSTTEEGNWFLMYYIPKLYSLQETIYVNRSDYIKSVKDIFYEFDNIVQKAITYEYRDWTKSNGLHHDSLDKMVGDYHFTCPVNEFAHYYALNQQEVYYYHFAHRSSQSEWPRWAGVLHGDEIMYIFGDPLDEQKLYTAEEKELSKMMMTYWANFAKTGNPNTNENKQWTNNYWPLYTAIDYNYLTLDIKTSRVVGNAPRFKKCAFWNNFIPDLIKYAAQCHPMVDLVTCASSGIETQTTSAAPTSGGLLTCLADALF